MLKNQKISVVVPSYNEQKMIGRVIETMPSFVDRIILVDDCSRDNTIKQAMIAAKSTKIKIDIIQNKRNKGVGAAIVAGYKWAIKLNQDVVAVMGGDAQMDPEELKDLCLPVVEGIADYSKGNRLIYGRAWQKMPKVRYLGNSVLSLLTKIASGYWHVADSQTGYTVISRETLKKIDLDNLYCRYGFPNDLLVHLNIVRARVKEIMIKPIYHNGGKSGIRLWKVIPTISWLLIRRFFWRLKKKYIIDDFHPLVFFYSFSFILTLANIYLLVRLIYLTVSHGSIPPINALALGFSVIMASQFAFFGMWLDMDDNRDLKVK